MHIPSFRCTGQHLTPAEQARCPVCSRKTALFKIKKLIDNDYFFGDSLAPFVGHFGYPNLNVGLLNLPQQSPESWLHDAQRFWASENYQIPQIIDLRSALVNSRFKAEVKSQNKLIETSQEIGMASKPVDVEVNLYKKPSFQMNFDSYSAPMGPVGRLKKAELAENPKIPGKVEKVHSDTDLKAGDAMVYLYSKNFDEAFLTRILSVGTIGLKTNRKLVPTRWSITAVDDTIGKYLINKIKDYPQINTCMTYLGNYLGNYYLVLMFPEIWSYELFESYVPRNPYEKLRFGTDYEPYEGRKSYAMNTAGGYYANRLPILEKLDSIKRQASILSLRFITSEYTVPMGVFVCREATRKSVNSKPLEFSDKELMLRYAKNLIKKKFNIDLGIILGQSIILRDLKTQTKLKSFI